MTTWCYSFIDRTRTLRQSRSYEKRDEMLYDMERAEMHGRALGYRAFHWYSVKS